MFNIKSLVISFALIILSGCSSISENIKEENKLNVNINYSQIFNLEHLTENDSIYIKFKDLSGLGRDEQLRKIVEKRIQNTTKLTITNDIKKANTKIHVTLTGINKKNEETNKNKSDSFTGAATGAIVGLSAGSIITSHENYYSYNAMESLLFGVLGGIIGYAITNKEPLDTYVISANITADQDNSEDEWSSYTTEVTATAVQKNMDYNEAEKEALNAIGTGIVELIK
ncbi:MAG: complement resistance protein TraT [Succinivibrionaceae bacterium]